MILKEYTGSIDEQIFKETKNKKADDKKHDTKKADKNAKKDKKTV